MAEVFTPRLANDGDAAGTQFARFAPGPSQTRPETYRMVAKITLLAAAILVVTPAAVTVALPSKLESTAVHSIAVEGPVVGFTQLDNRIQVRLKPATTEAERNARQRVVIRSAAGGEMTIPLKPGQTWASVELTGDLARAEALTISVD